MDPNQNPTPSPYQPQVPNDNPVTQPQQAPGQPVQPQPATSQPIQQQYQQPQPYQAQPSTQASPARLYLLIGLAIVGIILVVVGTVIPASQESQRTINRTLTSQDVLKDGVRVVGFLLLVISSGLLVRLKKKAK